MERVEIYGWTVQAAGGWRAVAIAVRSNHPERQRRLMYTGKTAEEAVQALARLTAILSTTCRRRGKRVVLRLLKEPPPGMAAG
jgi:hypothetical protein